MSSKSTDKNTIFVGKKPTSKYALSVLSQFNNGVKPIFIKARGRSISRAVDTSQLVLNRYLKDFKVKNVVLGTEQMDSVGRNGEPRKINISTIEIELGE